MKEENIPLVSVVVPCYNHEKYVKETIESIVNQTYKNIELIVIDDGSKDNSVKVIQELADKYGFIFIHRENKGLCATLNEGIMLSKGKYLCVCASDDIYILNKIEKQVAFMEQNSDYAMSYGKIIEFDENTEIKIEIKNPRSGFIFDSLLFGNFIPAVSQITRKEIFEDIGVFDENLYIEDWDMWLRIAEKYKIGFIDEYLAYYRIHETNISKNFYQIIQAEEKILRKYEKNKYFRKALNKRKASWFLRLLKNKRIEFFKFLPNIIRYLFIDAYTIK